MKLFRYRRPSLKTLLGVTKAKKRLKKDLGITALLKPFRWWPNQKRKMKREVGYYSETGRLIRDGVPKPGGCLVVVAVLGLVGVSCLCLLFLATPLLAADPQAHRDLAYVEPKNERQTLDVYAPAEGKDHPVVLWIHGGGWKKGDKAGVQKKPQAFVDKGFVFVSTNYRFLPDVTMKQMLGDVAKAIHWVHDHAQEYGGDPNMIFVMGHSAGAHLAALVCTDDSYLKDEGLSLAIIKGCLPVDVSAYDIPKRLEDGGAVPPAKLKELFGDTKESQRDLSPAAHIAKGKNIPPFLILHCADRPDTTAQSQWFADKLQEDGVSAKVVAAEGKTHGTINSDLGLPDDQPTQALWEFLEGVLHDQPATISWVKVAENQHGFVLDPSGRPFTAWGFNYDHDEQGRLLEDYWGTEWMKVEEDFAEMKQLGANVVRIHLQFGKFMDGPQQPNDKSLDRLADLLRLAESHHLYLDLTGLGCYHKKDVPAWYDKLSESARWDAQAEFWRAVAGRCKNSPAIFCYDLMNEPVVPGGHRNDGEWLGGAFAGKHFVQFITLDQADRPRPEIARRWVHHLTQAIRQVDQRHLVTVGLVGWSLDRPGLTSGFVPKEIAGDLDFLCVHLYPQAGKVGEALDTLAGFAIGKPVVIEETFPLKCSLEELEQFIDESKKHASGWIGFYWGQTPEQLRSSQGIGEALTLQWLELFQRRATDRKL